jgi:hypothetical protein
MPRFRRDTVSDFEFSYDTPAAIVDDPPITTAFRLGGISDDVARGIKLGLGRVPSISNVAAKRVVETRTDVT